MRRIDLPGRGIVAAGGARALTLWNKREPRERLLLAILAALAAAALLTIAMVRPLLAARAAALADIRTYDTLNARIRAAGPRLASGSPRRAGEATTIISASASEFGVPLQGSEPEGEAIRVTVAEAPFDSVIRWLAEIEGSSDLRVIEARFERRPTAGFIGARLLVAR